ncbi:MAG: hypothetical protein JWN02_2419, partial [Acidobacteria bacterium]|nr:hypothetical protein [Acidobacteriota bacterium]
MPKGRVLLASALILLSLSCATSRYDPQVMNAAAERYVKLVLALGEHDADYVDAYYGPPAWREEVKAAKPSVADI